MTRRAVSIAEEGGSGKAVSPIVDGRSIRLVSLEAEMEIQVNGEKRRWEGPVTVLALLEALGVPPAAVAVEINLRMVPRVEMARETVHDGDTIEIIRMVGGG
jgi:thiamine biosynthesis protein ThiS